MTTTDPANTTSGAAVATPVDQPVRPATEVRWYCVNRDGLATLCLNEQDAHEMAAECDIDFPRGGPHRAVRLVDAQQPLTRQQIDAVMTEHYPLDSLLRENVDAFEVCVRDIERLHGIGA
jgi:hypothetical protein